MPQMSPLWWFLLFLIFSVTLILFALLNYFLMILKPTHSHEFMPNNYTHWLTWKW